MKSINITATLAVAIFLPLAGAASVSAQDTLPDQIQPNPSIPVQQESAETDTIDKEIVGWQEAGTGQNGERVGPTLRANWIMQNATDGIQGQVLGVSGSMEVFLLRNGFVVGQTRTNLDGSFRLESAAPGPYSIVGYSPEAIFGIGLVVVDNTGEAVNMPQSLQILPVAGRNNNELIAKLIAQYAPEVNFRDYGRYDIGEGQEDPPQYYGHEGLKNLTAPAVPSPAIQHQPVNLDAEGSFIGRIHQVHNRTSRPVEVINTRLILIQDGEIIAETQCDNAGVFQFTGLSAGEYGLVAAGADGIATLGIELEQGSSGVNGQDASIEDDRLFRDASTEYDPLFREISIRGTSTLDASGFDATLMVVDSTGWFNNYVTEQTYINAMNEPRPEADQTMPPFDYFNPNDPYGAWGYGDCGDGGCYGGGGGGAGYFGGFTGLDLLWPIAGAALLVEAADDEDNNLVAPVLVPPVSPFDP